MASAPATASQIHPKRVLPQTNMPLHESGPLTMLQVGPDRLLRVVPKGQPVSAEIFFVHGLTEHPGRHLNTARFLSEFGFATTLLELKGHGGSAERSGKSWPFYRAYGQAKTSAVLDWVIGNLKPHDFREGQYRTLVNTRIDDHLQQAVRSLRDFMVPLVESRQVPMFLGGFSMGGLIVAESLIRRSGSSWLTKLLRGAFFISPSFRPKGRPGNRLENLIIDSAWEGRRLPFFPLRGLLKSTLEFNIRLDTTWGAVWMSDLPEEVALYQRDPLVHEAIPSAYASSIETLMTSTDPRADAFPVDALFMFPGYDGITSLDGGLRFAKRVESNLGPDRCKILQFDSTRAHDLTRSTVGDSVKQEILSWLQQRIG